MAIAQDGRVCVCVCGSTKAQEKLQIQKNVISALPSPFYKKIIFSHLLLPGRPNFGPN